MNLALLFFCCMATRSAIEAPKPKLEHRFYDRPAKIELALAVTASAFDNGQSCYNVSRGGPEVMLPTQSCAGITAILTSEVAIQELAAYFLHRTHHHKLERVIRFVTITANTEAIIYSKHYGAF